MISKNQIKLIRSLEQKKYRDKYGVFIAEGPKLVSELKDKFELVDLYEGDDVRKISLLDNPQGQFAIFRQRAEDSECRTKPNAELCLALDDVQNPGNLGTIIRIADWFGIEHIFCSQACADVYNPKVVQATMGGMARVHVTYCDLVELINQLDQHTPIFGTFLDGTNIYTTELSDAGLIVMGNEGHGISNEVSALVTNRILIPSHPLGGTTSDSLNVAVATAIVCAEFRRRNYIPKF